LRKGGIHHDFSCEEQKIAHVHSAIDLVKDGRKQEKFQLSPSLKETDRPGEHKPGLTCLTEGAVRRKNRENQGD